MTAVDFSRHTRRLVQYFWDPEPSNDASSKSPIWLLGKEYKVAGKGSVPGSTASSWQDITTAPGEILNSADPATPPDSNSGSVGSAQSHIELGNGDDRGWPPAFLDDFESKIWLTYRSNFPLIPKSQDPKAAASMSFSVRVRSQLVEPAGFTSDTGWGCMIRSGQSLLANSLVMLRMGRGCRPDVNIEYGLTCYSDWRRGLSNTEERKIISLFADDPKAPFSIHKFVEHGATACGKHPGSWFGPSATARCIQ
jgi:cysteine protease ATG4